MSLGEVSMAVLLTIKTIPDKVTEDFSFFFAINKNLSMSTMCQPLHQAEDSNRLVNSL